MGSYFDPSRSGWRYQFKFLKKRYCAPRAFRTKALAEAAERALRDRLMKQYAGIPEPHAGTGPLFTRWAGTTYDYAVERKQLRDPGSFERNLTQILKFWGAKPDDPDRVDPYAPYHGLTMDAPIRDGTWILTFEEWMAGRGLAGSTKNHYRSACSQLYAVAMLPQYRQQTGITFNPFRGIPRDPTRRRQTTFTRAEIPALLAAAPNEATRLAIRIALLAPELRLANILALTWAQVDPRLTWIRIAEHKIAGHTGRPLVTPIVATLRPFMRRAKATRAPGCDRVVQHEGAPINWRRMERWFERAVTALGKPYGAQDGEYSFHTLRHSAATFMAVIGLSEAQRKEAIGHLSMKTTQGYTHLTPTHKIAPLEQHAARLARAIGGKEVRRKVRRSRHTRRKVA